MSARCLRSVPRWVAGAASAVLVVAGCTGSGAQIPEGAAIGCVVEAPADPPPPLSTPQARAAEGAELSQPTKKAIARMLVSTSENSSLDWEAQYSYIAYDVEGNPTDNRGYTAGIIGFTSKTHDMLTLVRRYTAQVPDNPLAAFLPALAAVDGTSSPEGLGPAFKQAWRAAGVDPRFQAAQRALTDEFYFYPAVGQARLDGLGALGQFAYYDAIVMHGPGAADVYFDGIRAAAMSNESTPADGGDEEAFLHAFLDARADAMRSELAHSDTSRVDTQQRQFLEKGNLDLSLPLTWSVNEDDYHLAAPGSPQCPSPLRRGGTTDSSTSAAP